MLRLRPGRRPQEFRDEHAAMSTPNDPRDGDELSLQPSRAVPDAIGPAKPGRDRADFSNVQGHADTVPAASPAGGRQAGGAHASDAFSNVRSHADSVPADADAAGGGTIYTVQAGDTLSAIAQRTYGKASRWRAVFEANRDRIEDPDRIFPGQVIRLPVLDD